MGRRRAAPVYGVDMMERAERKRVSDALDNLVTACSLMVEQLQRLGMPHAPYVELLSQLDSVHFEIEKIRDGQNE